MHLRWEPADPLVPSIVVIRIEWIEVARVGPRQDGRTWLSQVARQRRDWRRRLHVVAPSQAAAMRWAMAWTRANLKDVLADLPTTDASGRAVWPWRNPLPEEWG